MVDDIAPSPRPPGSANTSSEVNSLIGDDDLLSAPEANTAFTTTITTTAPKSSLYLFLLTLGIGGLQVVWSVQHASASQFLLSLGMSKALLACAWVAGPLTGIVVQPYIGICSDNCRSRWGKRKPFMVAGAIVTTICLLALAWIREIVGAFSAVFSRADPAESRGESSLSVILLAMILVYCLDFAINTVQAGIRAYIVDNAPWHQQKSANAWASRVNGAGNILGYGLGHMDLPKTTPILGNTQFKALCVVASFSLAFTLLISCACVKERDANEVTQPTDGIAAIPSVSLIFKSISRLSRQTRKVFAIQTASWFGWFPFLFYATTYVGQLYVDPIFDNHRDLSDDDINQVWTDATRIGTFALFVNSIVSFAANIMLPLLIRPPDKEVEASASTTSTDYRSTWSCRVPYLGAQTAQLSKPILQKLWIPGLTLRRLWLLSHFIFAVCMFSTFPISTVEGASAMVGIVGVSWAITAWVPFAIIATEVAQLDAERQQQRHWQRRLSPSEEGYGDEDEGQLGSNNGMVLGQAGVVLGIHNVCISVPQVVSSVLSGVVFKLLQKPRGEPFDTSVAWVMRFGGCAALTAGILTMTLKEKQ